MTPPNATSEARASATHFPHGRDFEPDERARTRPDVMGPCRLEPAVQRELVRNLFGRSRSVGLPGSSPSAARSLAARATRGTSGFNLANWPVAGCLPRPEICTDFRIRRRQPRISGSPVAMCVKDAAQYGTGLERRGQEGLASGLRLQRHVVPALPTTSCRWWSSRGSLAALRQRTEVGDLDALGRRFSSRDVRRLDVAVHPSPARGLPPVPRATCIPMQDALSGRAVVRVAVELSWSHFPG